MGEEALFGDVRAVVHGSSTHVAWADLCLLVEGADPKTYRARLEPYLLDTLSDWPDEVRVAPVRWLSAACRGEDTPWLALARRLHLSGEVLRACATSSGLGRDGPEPSGVRALVALEDLRGVRELSVAGKWDQHGMFYTLCDAEVFENVRALRLYTRSYSNDPFAYQDFHGSVLARGLERLDLALDFVRPHDSFGRWCDGLARGSVPTLRALSLEGAGEDVCVRLEQLITAPALQGIESFTLHGRAVPNRALEVEPGSWPKLTRLGLSFKGALQGGRASFGDVAVGVVEALDASKLEALSLEGALVVDEVMGRLLEALGPENALEELRLSGCGLRRAEVERLVEFTGWSGLRALDLGGNEDIGAAAARDLLLGLDAPDLEALSLHDAGIDERRGVAGLARFGALREVDLSGKNTLRASGAKVVGELPNLEFAVLERAGLNGPGMKALTEGAAAGSLRYLDLRSNRLGREGIEALVDSELRPEVLYLGRDMVSNDLDGECMELLAGWEGLAGVRVLSASNSKLKQKDLMVLLRSEHLSGVEFLDISRNSLGKAGAAALAECDHLSNLRGLGIAACGLRKGGFTAFCGIDFMRKLAYLSIGGNSVDAELFEELWFDAQANFPALEWFDGGWGARDLAVAFPYAQIRRYSGRTSDRWLAPWMLPTTTKQPEFLSAWGV